VGREGARLRTLLAEHLRNKHDALAHGEPHAALAPSAARPPRARRAAVRA
jgi:hypothetical protein